LEKEDIFDSDDVYVWTTGLKHINYIFGL
jgi:hypothetical protein